MKLLIPATLVACIFSTPASAQHADHMRPSTPAATAPSASGQYAFATIAEVVRALKADASTDWSRVNLETLRQHLIDMDDVILRAAVVQKNVPGGMQLTITGTGRTAGAIKRMVKSHAHVLEEHTDYKPTAVDLASGVRLTVIAKDTSTAAVTMLRGLGFAGIMVEGEHHAAHHLMMAKGMGHH